MADDSNDIPFGRLNPISEQFANNKDRLNLYEPSFLSALRRSIKDRFSTDVLAGNTEYKAIVLKVLPENTGGGISHWLLPVVERLGGKTTILRVIARIPELHAHLPIPRDENDSEILGMYPVFEGPVSNGVPTAGQIVRVTFQNIYNLSGPIYIGVLTGENGSSINMTTNNGKSGTETFSENTGDPSGGSGGLTTNKKLTEFGAWSGAAAVTNPQKTLNIMRAIGLTHIDVMVNDASRGAVEKIDFHTYDQNKIKAMVKLFQNNGIRVSLSTWACPTSDWIAGMAVIGKLATECNVDGVTLDLEEAWLHPLKKKPQDQIDMLSKGLFFTLRNNFKGKIAVAPIVYADQKILNPILQLVDIIIPQCYSTTKNTANLKRVGDLERTAYSRYKSFGKEIIMGQAAWNLQNAYNLGNPANAIRASLTATLELGISKVRYWRLELIEKSLANAIDDFLPTPENVS